MKRVYGDVKFCVGMGSISGFAISDMKNSGCEKNAHFHVYDFENDEINLWCEDIEVELR